MKSVRINFTAVSVCLLALMCSFYAVAESPRKNVPLDGFEFVDRDIGEILYAVSMFSGVPISGDDTVSGKASFRFAGKDFDSAFESFLRAERLYVEKGKTSWTVSRVHFSKADSVVMLDACDVKPTRLLEKVSAYFSEEVTFDTLPEQSLSLHTSGSRAFDFVSAVVRQLGKEYDVEERNGKIHVTHTVPLVKRNETLFGQVIVEVEAARCDGVSSAIENSSEQTYRVDVRDSSMVLVLERLFTCGKKQFVLAIEDSVQLKRACFNGRHFDETLDLLCTETGLGFVNTNGMYYVFVQPDGRRGISSAGRTWRSFSVSYRTVSSVIPLLQNRFGKIETVPLPGDTTFLCSVDENMQHQIDSFLSAIDVPQNKRVVTLSYIHTEDLLSHLPPDVTSSQIVQGIADNQFFFTGSDKQYESLCNVLLTIDKPVKQIRYDLLVMQYQRSNDFSWDSSVSAKRLALGDTNGITAALGSVLNFNLDVLTTFGLKFAASLQSEINENKAHVFADTTLHGVNGGTINFKNTNTYRYRDNNVDPDTGKPIYSGVTREIVSGLKLDVTGWVSGDGMITSKVTASVSRQGVDVSSKTGNPPPTSEKTITTEVRGRSGEPVVLSGLVQDETTLAEGRTPLVAKIPLIGWLFRARKSTSEKTEMVIYLVPRCERENAFDANSNVESELGPSEKIISTTDSFVNEAKRNALYERLIKKYVIKEEKE